MNLEEFIKESINNIVRGVECSQKELENTNAVINPSTINERDLLIIEEEGKLSMYNLM